jgi:hypothetical protein
VHCALTRCRLADKEFVAAVLADFPDEKVIANVEEGRVSTPRVCH